MSYDIEYPSSNPVKSRHQKKPIVLDPVTTVEMYNAEVAVENNHADNIRRSAVRDDVMATGLTGLAAVLAFKARPLAVVPAVGAALLLGRGSGLGQEAVRLKKDAEQRQEFSEEVMMPRVGLTPSAGVERPENSGLQHARHEGRAIAAPDRQGKEASRAG